MENPEIMLAIMAGMITPIYLALFTIYRKLGYLEGCLCSR
jgi:hypothetical protein